MVQADAAEPVSVCVKFTAEERHLLVRRARDAGLPLAEYIHELVLAEAGWEEQTLHYMIEELRKVAEDNRRAVTEWEERAEQGPSENAATQRDRIAKEVRASLTQQEIAILAQFFKPAFDAGLWPELPHASEKEKS